MTWAGVLVMLLAGSVYGQRPADFSGTWVEDVSRRVNLLADRGTASSQSGGARMLPQGETVITQTPATLTIEDRIPGFTQVVRFAYQLDGSKSVNHNGAGTRTSQSRWEGKTLVTEGSTFYVTSQGESTIGMREVLALEKGELVMESRYSQDGKVTTATRRIFRRVG